MEYCTLKFMHMGEYIEKWPNEFQYNQARYKTQKPFLKICNRKRDMDGAFYKKESRIVEKGGIIILEVCIRNIHCIEELIIVFVIKPLYGMKR